MASSTSSVAVTSAAAAAVVAATARPLLDVKQALTLLTTSTTSSTGVVSGRPSVERVLHALLSSVFIYLVSHSYHHIIIQLTIILVDRIHVRYVYQHELTVHGDNYLIDLTFGKM
jgi:hypothetical protein